MNSDCTVWTRGYVALRRAQWRLSQDTASVWQVPRSCLSAGLAQYPPEQRIGQCRADSHYPLSCSVQPHDLWSTVLVSFQETYFQSKIQATCKRRYQCYTHPSIMHDFLSKNSIFIILLSKQSLCQYIFLFLLVKYRWSWEQPNSTSVQIFNSVLIRLINSILKCRRQSNTTFRMDYVDKGTISLTFSVFNSPCACAFACVCSLWYVAEVSFTLFYIWLADKIILIRIMWVNVRVVVRIDMLG